MSERYTLKDAEKSYERLRDILGKVETDYSLPVTDSKRLGSWHLDYNPTYGGCVIRETVSDIPGPGYTAETSPLGDMRRSPREFCEAVNFAIDVLNAANAGSLIAASTT